MKKKTIEQKVNFVYRFVWTIIILVFISCTAFAYFYFFIYTEKVTTVSRIVLDNNHTSITYNEHDKILCEDGVTIYDYIQLAEYRPFLECYSIRIGEYSFEDNGKAADENFHKCLDEKNKVCLVTHTERKVRV